MYFKYKHTSRLKTRAILTLIKKAGVAILVYKLISEQKNVIREQEDHFLMIEGAVQDDLTTVRNIYAPNNRTSNT